jgi:MFS family permease
VVAAIPVGLAIDRYSRVRLLLVFAIADVVGTALTALAPNFTVLFLARCLVGLTATATGTAAFSLLSDLFEPAQRGRASMVVVIGQFAGLAAAFAFGGALLGMLDQGPNEWRRAMLWLIPPMIAVTFSLFAMREPKRTNVSIVNPSAREAFAEVWRLRAVIAPVLGGLIMAETALGAVLVWAAPTLARRFGLSPDRVGAIMSLLVFASGVLGSIAGGTLADICQRVSGPRLTVLALTGVALLSVPAGTFAVLQGARPAIVLLFIFMMTIGAILVMAVALFTVVIPNELRGLCLSAMTGCNILCGTALAPITVSFLSGAIGGPTMIGKALTWVCVSASLMGAGAFFLGGYSVQTSRSSFAKEALHKW